MISRIGRGHTPEKSKKYAHQYEYALIADALQNMHSDLSRFHEENKRNSVAIGIANVASQLVHDIRSPLSVLKTLVEKIRSGSLPKEEMDELSGSAERSVIKLQNMAEDLLDCSKAQHINVRTVDIEEIVKEVLHEVSAEAAGHNVVVWYGGMTKLTVNVDREKMGRVLTNMVLNAIQAHEQPGYVSLKIDDKAGDLVIAIEDDGKGIPSENRDRIFDSSFTFGKPKGTGLGLAYCKQVIEAHNGWIDLKSEVGKGTTFTINMTNCIVSKREDAATGICTAKLECSAPAAPGPREKSAGIMIVDDDAEIRAQWKRIIDEKGGRLVYEAKSVDDVQKENNIDYSKIDTAIVDYHYEGSNKTGLDLIAHLKKMGVRRIHLCTGFHDDAGVRREAIFAGADSVIPKPINEDDVSYLLT